MKYKVSLYEETGGYAYIEARDKKEAETKAQETLDNEGINGFDNKVNCFNTTHREANVLTIERVK